MEIHRKNHTRPPDNHTHRIQVYPEHTKNFSVTKDEAGGVTIEAQCFDYDWQVTLSPDECKQLQQVLWPN
jgi:hypothetical protein